MLTYLLRGDFMNAYSEGKIIRMKLKTYGYECGRVPLEFDSTLKCFARTLIGLPENTVVRGYKASICDIVPKAKEIMEKYFKLHDIPYITNEKFTSVIQEICDGDIYSVSTDELGEIIKSVNESSKLISPFDLPLNLVLGHFMVGGLEKALVLVDNEDFLEKQPISFTKLSLGNNVTLLSSATAAHEYTHTQLDSTKGACKNYHNREVLPIFMEKLALLELDPSGKLLEIGSRMRNRDLFENIAILSGGIENFSRTELVESSVYVNSTLQANNLFDKYINGNSDMQASILSGIQDIFDGKSTVEELLDATGVTFENSAKPTLVKKIS